MFDTVASFGIDHNDDTAELHLDAVMNAEYVVQLAASDEHRKNFPLTNIDSVLGGLQLFLPGAHSDIGGGYQDKVDELDLQLIVFNRRYGLSNADKAAIAREREWLIESGWYQEGEIEENDDCYGIKVTRRGISNYYSRIPLKIMTLHAKQRGVNFREELLSDNEIPSCLKEVEELLMAPQCSPDHWPTVMSDAIRRLRHDYLHFSAYYGSTMGCHEPNFTRASPVRGRRRRRINNG